MSKPYNPDYHGSIVLNMKELWKKHTNAELKLSDKEIYDVYNEEYQFQDGSEETEASDQLYLEALKEANDKKDC